MLSLAEQLGQPAELCVVLPFLWYMLLLAKKVHLLQREGFQQPWHCLTRVLNVFVHSMFSVTGEDSTNVELCSLIFQIL